MGFGKVINASVRLEIIGADLPSLINHITKEGIVLNEIKYASSLCVILCVSRKEVGKVKAICKKYGCQHKSIGLQGLYWPVKAFLRRPVMIAGLLLLCLLALMLPSRVLFITVSGNAEVSDRYILEQAALCGINFGAPTAKVRSEQVKNEMLARLEQLQWVGINTTGCVAQIQVKENEQEKQSNHIKSNFDIRSSVDAVITYANATTGTLNCSVGQAVSAGQILISSHIQNGEVLLHTGAAGEVYGDTIRDLITVTPAKIQKRTSVIREMVNYSIIIGKKEINFWNKSGICSGSCVKMKERSVFTLPGGFQLPISFVKETVICYETENARVSDNSNDFLKDTADRYLLGQMNSGQILSNSYSFVQEKDLLILQADYACNEMIAKITLEE